MQKSAPSIPLHVIRFGDMTCSKKDFFIFFSFPYVEMGLLKYGISWTQAKSTLRPYINNGFVMKNSIWLMDLYNC